jgi:hypothetical protein
MAGVYQYGNRFQAFLGREGKRIYLGTFDSAEAAQAAYDKAKQEPTMTERNFRIDPKIQDLLPRQTTLEFEGLGKQIQDSEHVDSLVVLVINGDRVLGDGHHRLEHCEQCGIPYTTRDVIVNSWEEALLWVVENQLGRRNLTDERKSYYRGKQYLARKKAVGNPNLAETPGNPNSATLTELNRTNLSTKETAEDVAERNGVSPRTIERDAQFAEAVDKVAEEEGPNAREEILSGESGKTREEIIQPTKPPPTHERKKRVPNGSEVFKMANVTEHLGMVGKELDRLCHEYGLLDTRGIPYSREYTGISRKLSEVKEEVEKWHKGLQKRMERAG